MGVLNRTPDSFYDGGRYVDPIKAYDQAQRMIEQGVDLIDVGGESSRPGAVSIPSNEELDRVIPVIERLRASSDVAISVDTCKAVVMKAAVQAGATMINDIKALTGEGCLDLAAALTVPVCLMHSGSNGQGELVDEINLFFRQRIKACLHAKLDPARLILDPGFGFGKTVAENLTLLRHFAAFKAHCLPLLLGVSRKSTIGAVLQKLPEHRLSGSLALAVFAVMQGANLIRAHDVDETKQALTMLRAVVSPADWNHQGELCYESA